MDIYLCVSLHPGPPNICANLPKLNVGVSVREWTSPSIHLIYTLLVYICIYLYLSYPRYFHLYSYYYLWYLDDKNSCLFYWFSLKCQSSIVNICCYFERYQAAPPPVPTIASFSYHPQTDGLAVKMQETNTNSCYKLDKNIWTWLVSRVTLVLPPWLGQVCVCPEARVRPVLRQTRSAWHRPIPRSLPATQTYHCWLAFHFQSHVCQWFILWSWIQLAICSWSLLL